MTLYKGIVEVLCVPHILNSAACTSAAVRGSQCTSVARAAAASRLAQLTWEARSLHFFSASATLSKMTISASSLAVRMLMFGGHTRTPTIGGTLVNVADYHGVHGTTCEI